MATIKFVHWREAGAFLGYLIDYPDYWTQGQTLEELKEHLTELYQDRTSGQIPEIRIVDELVIT